MNGLKKGIDYISKSPNLYRVDKYQQKNDTEQKQTTFHHI